MVNGASQSAPHLAPMGILDYVVFICEEYARQMWQRVLDVARTLERLELEGDLAAVHSGAVGAPDIGAGVSRRPLSSQRRSRSFGTIKSVIARLRQPWISANRRIVVGLSQILPKPQDLRQQAECCRRPAVGITNKDVSHELLALARDLDKEATALKPEDVVVQPRRRRR
jgi:hypothetical protein